ncbi:MAG: DUF5309 domain-containing protein [Myxococcales bacterium]|nr:DUF5309 domain-containing protein [Myxococcales bacterium]
MGDVEIWRAPHGKLRIHHDFQCRDRDIFVVDKNYWSVDYLREFRREKLAKVGDSMTEHVLAEWTLCAKNEASSGGFFDASTDPMTP